MTQIPAEAAMSGVAVGVFQPGFSARIFCLGFAVHSSATLAGGRREACAACVCAAVFFPPLQSVGRVGLPIGTKTRGKSSIAVPATLSNDGKRPRSKA